MIELNAERKLNIEKLAKGDYISLEVLREVTGLDPGENSDLYRLALLGIRGKIERERKFTTRGDVYAIRILTDSEAVYQNEKTREHGIKKMERAYTRATAIDENALSEFRPPGVTRFQPLWGGRSFLLFRRPFGWAQRGR